MADALRRLRRWLETHPNDVGEHWKLGMLGSDPEALLVDTARRRVSSYFQNAERLYKAGLITRSVWLAAVDVAGAAVMVHIVTPLEKQLNPRADLAFVERLRRACPERANQLSTPIPLK
jgi:hypothetical protein